MYYIQKDNKIIMSAKFKFSDDCLYTKENIVRGYDGMLRFESEMQTDSYILEKNHYESAKQNKQLIIEKQERLTELTKDLAQVQAGLIIDNLEERKQEFRTLLNEVRVLQGKQPREIAGGDVNVENNNN